MGAGFESRDDAAQRLSALVDGELDLDETLRACSGWRDGGSQRATWHAYQLIGDVLRSSDLAADPAHDAAFLEGVRSRLASEPVVLAPRSLDAAAEAALQARGRTSRRGTWLAGSVVACGFVAVVAAVGVGGARGPTPQPAGLEQARGGEAAAVAMRGVVALPQSPRAEAAPQVAVRANATGSTDAYVHDAQLDRYLQAHQEFAGSSALGVPSAFLRSATLVTAGDR